MQTYILLASILAATGIHAAPLVARQLAVVVPNTQSCAATQGLSDDLHPAIFYRTTIGITYANGEGCGYIKATLQDYLQRESVGLTDDGWQCSAGPDGTDETILAFGVQGPLTPNSDSHPLGHDTAINNALEFIYPTIAGGFNCPGS